MNEGAFRVDVDRLEGFGFSVDSSCWPLLYIRFPSEPLTDEGIEAYGALLRNYLSLREPFATVIDARNVWHAVNARQRRRFATIMQEEDVRARELLLGAAVIIQSKLVRGAMTAVLWLKNPSFPLKVFGSTGAASPWLRQCFADAKVPIPARTESMLQGEIRFDQGAQT